MVTDLDCISQYVRRSAGGIFFYRSDEDIAQNEKQNAEFLKTYSKEDEFGMRYRLDTGEFIATGAPW